MESFSSRLKREREQRNITLEEISLATKIQMHFLLAIEHGHFEQIPGGIFSKGFLRAYARHIGIDEEETIAEYLAMVQAEELAHPPATSTREPQSGVREMRLSQWASVAAFVLMSFAVAELVYKQEEYREHPVVDSAAAVASQMGGDQGHKPVRLNPSAQKTRDTGNSENGRTAKLGDASLTNLVVSGMVPTPEGFCVSIRAREDAWLSIFVDGKRILETTLAGPAETAVAAHQQITVRAGNIGALDFSFNGRQLPRQGDYDEARTLIFDSNGLQEPVLKASTAVVPIPELQ